MSDLEPSRQPVLLHVEPEPCSGTWNMATDEYLLEAAITDHLKAVRLYRWEEATISLGYFQDANDESLSTAFRDLPVVRRLSGGGAILHDRELTYSFVLPADDPLATEPTELYGHIHLAIIDVLRSHHVDCAMRGEARTLDDEPFLCFVRGDRHDILCAGHKIVGSAQRRRKGAVLQHGSILLEHSHHATQIPGLRDLPGGFQRENFSTDSIGELELRLAQAISATLGTAVPLDGWSKSAIERIGELQKLRYRSLNRKGERES
ncbi:MAG: biotin/lipoate A/B protein ligase family protein [Planctomycetota bacterium]|nr:biotin/lipoate A/B protein ligase family protein [Planctomycetota bacterium]MDA1165867.1 biotin/lipoate A/B protein ligase family protein [Planctomycetota bacterium]